MRQPHDPAYNRDDEIKPGSPPRHAQEPKSGKNSTRTPKTMTDPATGESQRTSHAPNQADPPRRRDA